MIAIPLILVVSEEMLPGVTVRVLCVTCLMIGLSHGYDKQIRKLGKYFVLFTAMKTQLRNTCYGMGDAQ